MSTTVAEVATLAATPSVAEVIHAKTLNSPAPMASNAAILDNAARETVETQTAKQSLITKCQAMWSSIKGHRLGLGPLQAALVGFVAELLLLKPTNKELAAAMAEPYDENYHGVQTTEVTVHTDEFVDFGANRDPANPRDEIIPRLKKDGTPSNPNPYAQSVRRYKLLAMIEAGIPGEDALGNPWDFSKVEDGVLINSVRYASPVAALMSGVVSMEAVFVAWTNLLQPRVLNLKEWSTSVVDEAKAYAPKVVVVVRKFDKKMNREAKHRVFAVQSASCLYGVLMGLIEYEDEKNPVNLGRMYTDRIIAALNAKVDVATTTTTNEAAK